MSSPRHDLIIADGAGVMLDVLNDTGAHMDVNYASLTAPKLVRVDVAVNDKLFDAVWVGPGSSHSWWTQAGGKFLDHNGLDPGHRLTITATGPCALRLDWV